MIALGIVPTAKNVIPKGLSVNISCQRTYGHEKATVFSRGYPTDIRPISSVAS
jgi:hypothetical protein